MNIPSYSDIRLLYATESRNPNRRESFMLGFTGIFNWPWVFVWFFAFPILILAVRLYEAIFELLQAWWQFLVATCLVFFLFPVLGCLGRIKLHEEKAGVQ